jgi:hypothetical protein
MSYNKIDLTNPEFAYMFGFIQTDGSMYKNTRNRGRVSIEIKSSDEYILEKFASIIPYSCSITQRTRNTNFKDNYKSSTLSVCSFDFRNELLSLGIPYGKKSDIVTIPSCNFSKIDYFRGVIDGNGSLGLTSKNIPFISLITASGKFANEYLRFVFDTTGKQKTTSRNTRDGVYNIALFSEDAQKMVSMLYYNKCLALPRKIKNAYDVINWVRPNNMVKICFERHKWVKDDDDYVLSHTIEESMEFLKRTRKSIAIRKYRLISAISDTVEIKKIIKPVYNLKAEE